jgi:hypothetical protein
MTAAEEKRTPKFLRRLLEHPAWILLRDFALFLVDTREDLEIEQKQVTHGARPAFDAFTTTELGASSRRRHASPRRGGHERTISLTQQGIAEKLGVRARKGYVQVCFPAEVETTWPGS